MSFSNSFQPVALAVDTRDKKLVRVWYEDKPIVLFRNDQSVYAYEDYCPHRGAPLSEGFILDNQINCVYHGWRFDCKDGSNTFLPVKNQRIDCKLKQVYAIEKYNLIWLSYEENAELPYLMEDRPSIIKAGFIKAKMANVIENFLEGSHTHYVHEGLVRSKNKARQEISAELVPNANGFKVYYTSEKAKGLLTKILPKKFQALRPVATYIYPNTTILEYFNQDQKLISRFEGVITAGENGTNYFARIFLNFGIVTPLVAFFSAFFFNKIIGQDKRILEIQDLNLKHYPHKKFISDETDIVGQQIFAWLYDRNKLIAAPLHFKVFW